MKNHMGAVLTVFCAAAALGCARVNVAGGKEPIKVDVSMRVDIYQHVEKDIDSIESIVNGQAQKAAVPDKQSMLSLFVGTAYAQEALGQDVEDAARRRGSRKPLLDQWMSKAVIGENKAGLVEIRSLENSTPEVEDAVKAENKDRMVIYHAIASKNGTTLEEVQKLYSRKLQASVPAGAPVEAPDGTWTTRK